MRSFLSLLLCWLTVSTVSAQDSIPTAPVDSLPVHSVKKAVIFSAVLPGAGQVYNHLAMPKGQKKAYWKVPLIYAGLGATGYFMIHNNQLRKELRQEYDNRQGTDPTLLLEKYEAYDDEGILQLHDMHRTRRDLSILAFGVVYILNVVDAGVEAHFVNFDVSDDLSLSLEPTLVQGFAPGVGVRLTFKR